MPRLKPEGSVAALGMTLDRHHVDQAPAVLAGAPAVVVRVDPLRDLVCRAIFKPGLPLVAAVRLCVMRRRSSDALLRGVAIDYVRKVESGRGMCCLRTSRPVRPQQPLQLATFADWTPTQLVAYTAGMSSLLTQRDEVPGRSADQRREALTLANDVRTKRAALKAKLKNGRVSIAALIAGPPQYAASAKVTELLKALPGYGPVKVARLLERCRVSPHKTIGGLNERQRAELSRALQT